jgi:hypothetical protein
MCDFTEINDLNNQIIRNLAVALELTNLMSKNPQMLALCHQLVIPLGMLKN